MKTLVLGASDNPERYAWKAAELLHSKGHEVIAVGIKKAFSAELKSLAHWSCFR
jgi:predicted CoA-binding protein